MSFRILILGGGFTGLEAARRLAKHSQNQVTLLDPNAYALFTPRLIDALAGVCCERDLRLAHGTLAKRHGYTFFQAQAETITHQKKTVHAIHLDGSKKTYAYDTLICCYGATTNFYETSGESYAYPFKTWEQLVALEERLATLTRSKQAIRAVVIGGGATGIEVSLALDLRLRALGYGPEQRTITVIQAAPQILPGFVPKTVERANTILQQQQISLRLATAVKSLQSKGLTTQKDESLPADLIIWAAGVRPNQVANDLAVDHTRQALSTDYMLRVEPGFFAGGDAVHIHDIQRPVPKNAQTALKMGRLIADNVMREQQHRPLLPFRYRSSGVLLWLGSTATLDLVGLSFKSRFFAWIRHQFYTLRWYLLTRH